MRWQVIDPKGINGSQECTYDLLLAVFWAGNEIHGFHVSNVDFVTEDIREDDLGYVSVS